MSQGSFFLSLWPAIADKRLGPAPAPGIHPRGDTHPIVGVELPDYGGKVLFPNSSELRDYDVDSLDFNSLDQNTQELLVDITQQDTFSRYAVTILLKIGKFKFLKWPFAKVDSYF